MVSFYDVAKWKLELLRIGFTEGKYFKSTSKWLAFKGERVGLKIAKLRMHVVLDEIHDVIFV